jgi:LEA14-like dessication related protein
MRNLVYIFLALFVLTACEFEDVQFKGIAGFRFGKLEGKTITCELDVKVENPNNYNLKVKPSKLEVYIENQVVGNLYLVKKAKIKRKRESVVTLPLKGELADGAMLSLVNFALKDKVTIRLKGQVKGGVAFISKKIDVDKSLTVPGNKLNLQDLMKGLKN